MIDLGKELAVQSFTYRHFEENAVVIEKLKDSGSTGIELCGRHADFADESCFDEVVSLYKDSGVDIVAIGVQSFTNDEAAERKFFEFGKRAGIKVMSANFKPDSTPESFRTAEKLADEYDINLAIHNHGGRHWLGSSEMLRHVFATTSPRIGLCLDTAWAMDAREDPLRMAQEFSERLYGLHIKDFVFDRARKPEDVVVGTGNLDLAGLVAVLRDMDFNGYAALEYEGDVENPVPAVQKCVKAVRAVC